jgi:hypothetical protein
MYRIHRQLLQQKLSGYPAITYIQLQRIQIVKSVMSDTVERLGRSLYWRYNSHCYVIPILIKCWLIHLKHILSLTDTVHYILIFKILNSIPYFSSEYFRDVPTLKKTGSS